ncbi:hypothetical protein B0H14DRAFT_3557562 [Mycena olivaceomarginata]|nr:hypothetical protein B0H14DRAFT_3557562 [Mycena olivaceomarginata]
MTQKYEVWFRLPLEIFEKQLANPNFKDEIDWAPKRIFKNGKRQLTDLFSGNWAWKQTDEIGKDPSTHGAMFVPTTREYTASTAFRKFRRQLFHASLARILDPLKPHMTVPRITRCADGHFWRVIYGIGPYIADYPEQALLTNIVPGWFAYPPADNLDRQCTRRSHEHTDTLLEACTLKELWDDFGIVGDLIGTFKDHVVEWVQEYIEETHESAEAARILADIDRRYFCFLSSLILMSLLETPSIAVTTPFPGLRHFHTGRGTVVKAGIIEFCYLVRRSVIDEDTLVAIEAVIVQFDDHRGIFRATSRPDGFSLPRQHSITHYPSLIRNFVRKVPRDVHQLAEYVEQPRLCELIRRFLFDQLNPDLTPTAPISGANVLTMSAGWVECAMNVSEQQSRGIMAHLATTVSSSSTAQMRLPSAAYMLPIQGKTLSALLPILPLLQAVPVHINSVRRSINETVLKVSLESTRSHRTPPHIWPQPPQVIRKRSTPAGPPESPLLVRKRPRLDHECIETNGEYLSGSPQRASRRPSFPNNGLYFSLSGRSPVPRAAHRTTPSLPKPTAPRHPLGDLPVPENFQSKDVPYIRYPMNEATDIVSPPANRTPVIPSTPTRSIHQLNASMPKTPPPLSSTSRVASASPPSAMMVYPTHLADGPAVPSAADDQLTTPLDTSIDLLPPPPNALTPPRP